MGDDSALVLAIRGLADEVARLRAVLETRGPAVSAPAAVVVATPVVAAAAEPGPAQVDIDGVLAGIFSAAMDLDDDAGFDAFVRLIHTDRTDAPHSIPSLKEFSWKSLRKNRDRYLGRDGDPASFRIARRVPPELQDGDRTVKVFIEAKARNPVPVTLKKDKSQADAWRVTDISL